MASKLAAAKIAAWSGVPAVIAAASRPNVLVDATAGAPGVGTLFRPREKRLASRKLWIAFAMGSSGTVVVDDGARRALTERNVSLLPAGVVSASGRFEEGDAVEVADATGVVFAKGLVRHAAAVVNARAGLRTADLPDEGAHEVIHRDDLVVLP
jgi:glutamate 5-kinase